MEKKQNKWTKEYKAKWNKEWIINNRDRYNASKYNYRDRVKLAVLEYYSNGKLECAKCKFSDIDCLCLDHIDDNGAAHRKELNINSRNNSTRAGGRTYEALKIAGFPSGLQTLCANCNMKKEMVRKTDHRLKNKFIKYERDNLTL